jgi:ribosomal protein L3 glutamine methyltransferase
MTINLQASTIRECVDWAAKRFESSDLYYGHGTDNPYDEAAWLVLHTLSLPLDLDDDQFEQNVTAADCHRVEAVVNERIHTRSPAAYLTGEGWFCGLPFYVDQSVLVPRSPIAELIEQAFEPWVEPDRVKQVLDIGTGSGCIGIACALVFPEAKVDLCDISPEALAVARRNIERYELEDRVHAHQADVFEGLTPKRYDLIVSNPPYVDAEDMAALPEEYRREPELGLAAGVDGLDIVRRILQRASEFLTDEGVLVVEVGNSEEALFAAYPELPFTWLEFSRGGQGVFLLTAKQLSSAVL